jgi:hypothetical protein
MEDRGNAYTVLVGKPAGEDLGIDGGIILKCTLKI